MQKAVAPRSPIKIRAVYSLAYVLTSSYLIARLGIDWWLMGTWDFNLQFVTNAVAISALQLLVLSIFLRLSPDQITANTQPRVKRFLLIWLCLFIAFFLATALTSVFLLKNIDIRYVRYFQLMAIPLLQSLVVIWVITPGSVRFPADAFRQIFSRPGIVGLLLLGIGFLVAGIAFLRHDYLGFLGTQSILPAWTGLQLAVAGIIALALLKHESYKFWEQIWIVGFSCISLAMAVDIVFPGTINIPLISQNSTLMIIQLKFTPIFIFIQYTNLQSISQHHEIYKTQYMVYLLLLYEDR